MGQMLIFRSRLKNASIVTIVYLTIKSVYLTAKHIFLTDKSGITVHP